MTTKRLIREVRFIDSGSAMGDSFYITMQNVEKVFVYTNAKEDSYTFMDVVNTALQIDRNMALQHLSNVLSKLTHGTTETMGLSESIVVLANAVRETDSSSALSEIANALSNVSMNLSDHVDAINTSIHAVAEAVTDAS
jgi:hypothetical protein